ncbi:MAG: hypothetical protein K2X39_00690 [Silvanigrellaceae bacterium]|nr:hypothetical protein [Silvanigrellaceae bacterium]
MKTSCIRQPQKSHSIQISAWQVEFCRGNHCAAFILSYFIDQHDSKLNHDHYCRRASSIIEFHDNDRSQNQDACLFFSVEYISEGILGTYGNTTIFSALKLLEELGAISIHTNPNLRYPADKTKYFIFYPDVCNDWIEESHLLKAKLLDTPKSREEFFDNHGRLKTNDREFKIKSRSLKNEPLKNTLKPSKSNKMKSKEI